MPRLLWDASALIKCYYEEVGTDTARAVLRLATAQFSSITTYMGFAETAAILRRKHNQGLLTIDEAQTARQLLQSEILIGPRFELLSVDDADVLSGMALTDRHNINSTDAAILAAFLRRAQGQTGGVLVAADRRLLRAAVVEGLATLNPELLSASEIPAVLASA